MKNGKSYVAVFNGREWGNGTAGLFSMVELEKLVINHYSNSDLGDFRNFKKLRELQILDSSLKSIKGIQALESLTNLRLGLLTKLESLSGIEGLGGHLVDLDIDTCKKITKIDELSKLIKLKKLGLANCGKIKSLLPLKKLECLEELFFTEDTNIEDGDINFLAQLSNLKKAWYMDRKHYSFKRDDLKAILENRRGKGLLKLMKSVGRIFKIK